MNEYSKVSCSFNMSLLLGLEQSPSDYVNKYYYDLFDVIGVRGFPVSQLIH